MRRNSQRRTTKKNRRRPVHRRKPVHRSRKRRQLRAPLTARQFFGMSTQAQREWTKVIGVISEARATGTAPRKISKRRGIDFTKVLHLGRPAFRMQRNGRYVIRPTDKLLRILIVPTRAGLREIATRDSRQATLLAKYWTAVSRYLRTGDASALQEFNGKKVSSAGGRKIPLLPDYTTYAKKVSCHKFK